MLGLGISIYNGGAITESSRITGAFIKRVTEDGGTVENPVCIGKDFELLLAGT